MTTDLGSIKNILLVEGDPREAQLTLATLEERGLANKLAIVDNGAEALDYLYRRGKYEMRPWGNPILVLLDLALAEVKRLEVLEIIKADEYLKLIPVVVLSNTPEAPELAEVLTHRVNACVPKPVDLAEFMKSIEQLGPFWEAVDEPPPPASGNAGSPDLIYGKGRTPNWHGGISTLKYAP